MTLAIQALLVAVLVGPVPHPSASTFAPGPTVAAAASHVLDATGGSPAARQDESVLDCDGEHDDDDLSAYPHQETGTAATGVPPPGGGRGALRHRGARPSARSLLRLCGRL